MEAVKVYSVGCRAATVKSELATSMAAVCPGGSTVPATVIIVVKYRLVYQLVGRSQAHRHDRLVGSRLYAYQHDQLSI